MEIDLFRFDAAVKSHNLDEIRACLKVNPDYVRTERFQHLYFKDAARHDDLELVQAYVACGADINQRLDPFVDIGVIDSAAMNGALRVARWLLEQGVRIHDVKGGVKRCQPLLTPAHEGNLEMVKLLVEVGQADVNCTWGGQNALSMAMDNGHQEVVDYLRLKGAKTPAELAELNPATAEALSSALVRFITAQLGKPEKLSIQEIVQSKPSITIHVARNEEDREQILVTEGMSSLPMTVPKGGEAFEYAELVLRLPIDWPLTPEAFSASENFWPVEWLRRVALYPHLNKTWLGGRYALIANDEPPKQFAPNTELSCLLLMASHKGYGRWRRPDGKDVVFYDVIPLYIEERDLEKSQGLPALLGLFDDYSISPVVNPTRANVAVLAAEENM